MLHSSQQVQGHAPKFSFWGTLTIFGGEGRGILTSSTHSGLIVFHDQSHSLNGGIKRNQPHFLTLITPRNSQNDPSHFETNCDRLSEALDVKKVPLHWGNLRATVNDVADLTSKTCIGGPLRNSRFGGPSDCLEDSPFQRFLLCCSSVNFSVAVPLLQGCSKDHVQIVSHKIQSSASCPVGQ